MSKILENIKKIAFNRPAGSIDEATLSDMLYYEFKKESLDVVTDSFEYDDSLVKYVKFEVLEPYYKEYKAYAYGLSGYTPRDGIEADLLYIEDALDANLVDAKDKIVITNGRMVPDLYCKLYYKRVKAFITFYGSLYNDNTVSEKKYLGRRHLEIGRLLGINIHIKDAEEIIEKKASRVRISVCQEEIKVKSTNVIVTIPGTINEQIVFTAHLDSTSNSNGYFDNATGVSCLMELINYFKDNPTYRTLKFVFCTASNRGFLGIRDYLSKNEDTNKKIKLNINLDAVGTYIGQNVAYCATDPSLCSYINMIAHEQGLSIITKNTICPSDSIGFTERLIPSLSFHKEVPIGGPLPHSHLDSLDNISISDLESLTGFIKTIAIDFANSKIFMIPYKLSQTVIDDCDRLNGKRKSKC